MPVVIRDATLITVDPDDTVLYGAALAVEGGRIAAIGPTDTVLSRFPDAETVDGRGKLVMPGFANVHMHFTLIIAKRDLRGPLAAERAALHRRAGAAPHARAHAR